MKNRIVFVGIIFWVSYSWSNSFQNPDTERGLRIVELYSALDMNAGTQNFCMVQDYHGSIFVGNLTGVIEYNGAYWNIIPLPNHSAAKALGVTRRGTILVGGYDEIGYLAQNEFNQNVFISLKTDLPEKFKDFEEVIQIFTIKGEAYISTKHYLFQLNDMKLHPLMNLNENHETSSFFVFGDQLFRQTKTRITPIGSDAPFPGPAPPDRIQFLLRGDACLLENGSVFHLKDGEGRPDYLPLESWLKGSRISSIGLLPGGRTVVCTRDKGVLILDQYGQPYEVIDSTTGLPINDVRGHLATADGALWLALNNGVARVDISSSVTQFDYRSGLEGGANCLVRHAGSLYFGSSAGLFVMNRRHQEKTPGVFTGSLTKATRVNSPRVTVWDLLPLSDSQLLVATSKGLFILKENEFQEIPDTSNFIFYCLKQSPSENGLIYLGSQNGFGLLKEKGEGFEFGGLVQGMPNMIRSIQETQASDVWVGTTLDGAWRIHGLLNQDGSVNGNLSIEKVGTGEVDLFWFRHRLCFNMDEESFYFNEEKGALAHHPLIGPEAIKSKYFRGCEDSNGYFWMNTQPLTKVSFFADSPPLLDNYTYRNLPGHDIQVFYPEADGTMWLASESNLIKIENDPDKNVSQPFSPKISKVFYGNEPVAIKSGDSLPLLPYGANRMKIEFAPMNYEPNTLFQYRLDPLDADWSEWSRLPFIEYTNLWEGTYLFRMRMREVRKTYSSEARFGFRVKPPWHRTLMAFFVYFLILALSLYFFVKWRYNRLRHHANLLKAKVKKQTQKLETTLLELKDAKRQVEENNLQLQEANLTLKNISMLDGLTGIANRRRLDAFLLEEWSRAARLKLPTTAIILDIDFFKQYNDILGHLEGDQCLSNLSNYLAGLALRSNDLVARYGGEEFVVVLPNCVLENGMALAEEIRSGIEGLNMPHPKSPFEKVTASLGVACCLASHQNRPAQLLKLADQALYHAKETGRNRVSKSL